jgi:hypothetical protein
MFIPWLMASVETVMRRLPPRRWLRPGSIPGGGHHLDMAADFALGLGARSKEAENGSH